MSKISRKNFRKNKSKNNKKSKKNVKHYSRKNKINKLRGGNQSIEQLIKGISKNDPDFTELVIDYNEDNQQNDFTVERTKALAAALQNNTYLTSLSIRHNIIDNEGMLAIAEALKVNKKLTTLDLTDNFFNDDIILELDIALSINTTLTTFKFSNILISNQIKINKLIQRNRDIIDPEKKMNWEFINVILDPHQGRIVPNK